MAGSGCPANAPHREARHTSCLARPRERCATGMRESYRHAKREQPAVTVLDDEFPRLPRRVAERARERGAASRILGVQLVYVLDNQICVEQFVGVLIRTGCRRIGETEVNPLIVAPDDGVNGRVEPAAETLEAERVAVIGERRGHVGCEELRRNLPDHCDRTGFDIPYPPIGTVSTRVPKPAIIGRPFAMAAWTAGNDSDALWHS